MKKKNWTGNSTPNRHATTRLAASRHFSTTPDTLTTRTEHAHDITTWKLRTFFDAEVGANFQKFELWESPFECRLHGSKSIKQSIFQQNFLFDSVFGNAQNEVNGAEKRCPNVTQPALSTEPQTWKFEMFTYRSFFKVHLYKWVEHNNDFEKASKHAQLTIMGCFTFRHCDSQSFRQFHAKRCIKSIIGIKFK